MYNKFIHVRRNDDTVSYETLDIAKSVDVRQECEIALADYSFVSEQLRKMLGEMLTIVDASFPPGKQNKAVKDLVRKAFTEEYQFVSEFMYDQKKLNKMANKSYEVFIANGGTPKPMYIDEALGLTEEDNK